MTRKERRQRMEIYFIHLRKLESLPDSQRLLAIRMLNQDYRKELENEKQSTHLFSRSTANHS